MKTVVRRRLIASAGVSASALVAGLLLAPASTAATGGVRVEPNGAINTETAKMLTYRTTDADLAFGAVATYSYVGASANPFTDSIEGPGPARVPGKDTEEQSAMNFADVGTGIRSDGPADAGVYSISITGNPSPVPGTGGGGTDTCTSCFTVLAAGPVTVTSVTPKLLRPGQRSNIVVLGNNFERSSTIEFLFPDGSVDSSVTANAPSQANNADDGAADVNGITTRTELKRRATVAAGAAPGARDVRVTNLDGTNFVCTACFFVSGPPLTSISKTAEFNDPNTPLTTITFTGSNVTEGAPRLEFVGNPGSAARSDLTILGQNVRDYTGTSITADYDLRNAAPSASGYQPVVEGPGGVTNACDCRFTVVQRTERTPTLANLDSEPSTAGTQKDIRQGESKEFTVNGTNFSKGATLTFSGTAGQLTVTAVRFVSPEQFVATISATSGAATGPRDVRVVLTDSKTSEPCAGCINVVTASASPPPSSTATATNSPRPSGTATATATMSPSPQQCPTNGTTVRVNTRTINATGLASVTVSGARPNAQVELQGYSQNHEGTVTFANDPTPIDRVGRADSNGSITFNDLRPASNTRLRARQAGCTFIDQSDVIEVRAQETLEVRRTGDRAYTFSGRSIPAREGGLIISLYRIVGQACRAGVEPRNCAGERLIGQGRAVALGQRGEGLYSIRIQFPARDENVRDEFVVKTGRDAQNAPGRSNARSLLIN